VRFSYIDLADAANTTAEGKVNIIGAGTRAINTSALPVAVAITLVATIQADPSDAGNYPLDISLHTPSERRDLYSDKSVNLPAENSPEAELPIALNIQLALHPLTLNEPGLHRIHARFGKARADYLFVVRLVESEATVATS
jgi:hypothetical protein